jgi:hypothetical protein
LIARFVDALSSGTGAGCRQCDGLQYFRRKTITAHLLVIASGLLLLTAQFLPWRPEFAIEERLSPKPGAGADTEVTFDQVGENSSRRLAWLLPQRIASAVAAKTTLKFPSLQIAGVRNDAILLAGGPKCM